MSLKYLLFIKKMNNPSKILIVGCGLTGSVAANLIKHEASAEIEIWEKESYIGGRFHTFVNPSNKSCSVDLGAQFISATLQFMRNHARFYDELLGTNKLVPLNRKIENFRKLSESKLNFVAPQGTLSLIQHFLENTGAEICSNREVTRINLNKDRKMWEVSTSSGFVKEFDTVILTIPVPEILKLEGNFQDSNKYADDHVRMLMEQVTFSSRYAVALMYKENVDILENLPWSMKFFPDNQTICYIAVDNVKRGKNKDTPSVLLHTTTKFPLTCTEKSDDEVKEIVFQEAKCLIPHLPDPAFIKCIKWTHSQVSDSYLDNPGCVVMNEQPCLIAGGDSFTESHFNGCITSALRIVEELIKHRSIAKSHSKKQASVDDNISTK